ncbi:hypothetical protein IscW_ISCW022452 [Ixodes scapularis]|uniref:Uncharacterized protein n=1 Tax=Ixodes scapularis TaxID=6945 RepID=B7QFD7_IXOSC|nr:hypothetical protein IscW_ISCW022452 [Ixodes scapularis]|eukprot:XP_002414251.1 hypothetical protein IscW_ISCW022452 [Ixodes scapularis]
MQRRKSIAKAVYTSLRRSRSDGAGGDTSSEDEDDLVTTGVDDVRAGASGGLTSSLGSSVSSGGTSAHIPAFEVCAVSPRKRHRQDRGGGTAFGVFSLVDGGPVQRPCLDFEKMQQ